jgi:hypothetical protein
MAWSGVTAAKKGVMKSHRYFDSQTNILTLVTLVGTSQFMMTSIFMESILNSPPPITYPKNTNDC